MCFTSNNIPKKKFIYHVYQRSMFSIRKRKLLFWRAKHSGATADYNTRDFKRVTTMLKLSNIGCVDISHNSMCQPVCKLMSLHFEPQCFKTLSSFISIDHIPPFGFTSVGDLILFGCWILSTFWKWVSLTIVFLLCTERLILQNPRHVYSHGHSLLTHLLSPWLGILV